jgi:hypothetical protein
MPVLIEEGGTEVPLELGSGARSGVSARRNDGRGRDAGGAERHEATDQGHSLGFQSRIHNRIYSISVK